MTNISTIVQRNKASNQTRFANYAIDLLIFYGLIFLVFIVIMIISGDPEALDGELEVLDGFAGRIVTLICYAIYMMIVEIIFKGKSLGKLLTGTKVVMQNGDQPKMSDLFLRNIIRAVPFDQLSFFGNNGWHDQWSKTRVVKTQRFENDLLSENEINRLGSKEIV